MMLLKRKRSANNLTSPTTDSHSNTVQSFYPHTKPILPPFHPSKQTSFDAETPSHLNVRTRKRHRDNRPDAEAVHGASTCWLGAVIQMRALADVTRVAASTIQRLYQAQRENVAAEPGIARGQEQQQHLQQDTEQYRPTQPQKSTLHSFWRIEQPIPSAMPVQRVEIMQEPRCEDCDGGLRDEGAMDVDEGSIEDKACGSCRRPICDSCAIFGRERICAGCAGCERGW